MERGEDEALYGGAAGGGKSDALIIEATRQVHIPYYKGLIIRKTYPQLAELIDKSLNYYPKAFPGARYNASSHTWVFPSGAKIIFGSMPNTQSKINYQGQAYDFIGFDELTHFTYEEYIYLASRNRPNGPGTRCYMRATCNPGNVGHGWVKERFVSAAEPMTTIWEEVEIIEPSGLIRKEYKSRIFIPSTVFDNQILLNNDPQYLVRLASMPEAERKALLYGDWDSFSGAFWSEWRPSPDKEQCKAHDISVEDALSEHRWTHVIEPFPIPKHWPIYKGYDWGFGRPFASLWATVSPDDTMYVFAELYGCTKNANEGVKWTNRQQADAIQRTEREHPLLKGKQIRGFADPSIWDGSHDTDGISCAEEFEKHQLWYEKGNNERIAGWMQVRERLKFDSEGYAKLYVFNTCPQLIRCFPLQLFDEHHVEDMDTRLEDHLHDSLRYMCMGRPIPAREIVPEIIPISDPLNQFRKYNGKYRGINGLRGI